MLGSAVDAMHLWLRDGFGNPSGVHRHARAARQALEESRDVVAAAIGAAAREIVFTGGGSEALNLAFAGSQRKPDGASGTSEVVISAIEHDAVRNAAGALALRDRAAVRELVVDARGVVDIERAAAAVEPGTTLLAVMAVNNEVGTIQPVIELIEIARRVAPGCVVVVDAVQALSWCDVRPITAAADLIAFSAHKFGGPKGVGCLAVREGLTLTPIIYGGGQERDRRSGTQNVAGIVAMAEAARVADATRSERVDRVTRLRDRLVDGLLDAIPAASETSPRAAKVAGNAHLCIEGIESEELLVLLDQSGISASAGSACASGAMHASPVLLAMGISKERALGSLRLSLGATTTDADVDLALEVVPACAARLLRVGAR